MVNPKGRTNESGSGESKSFLFPPTHGHAAPTSPVLLDDDDDHDHDDDNDDGLV